MQQVAFVITKTSKCIKTINLLSYPGDALVREKDTRSYVLWPTKTCQTIRETPRNSQGGCILHVIDACSGVASCGVACQLTKRKCIIMEKCEVKSRLINQRLKQ